MKSKWQTFQLRRLAETSNATIAWQEPLHGQRVRRWCKECRDEGKPWLTPEPCSHVLEAISQGEIPEEIVLNTLRAFQEPADRP